MYEPAAPTALGAALGNAVLSSGVGGGSGRCFSRQPPASRQALPITITLRSNTSDMLPESCIRWVSL